MQTQIPTETFSYIKCKELWEKDIDITYNYVNSYYFRLIDPIGVLFWDCARRRFQYMTYQDLKRHMPELNKHVPIGHSSGKFTTVSLQQIWYEKTLPYSFVVDPSKPMFYESNGAYYLNHFLGSPHNLDVKYSDMSDDVKKGVEFIWSHIKNILCSKDEKSFKYVHDWICNTICFKRNLTALYIKSLQGVGKSIITDFLIDKVLTHNISYRTGDSSVLSTWNASLVGKVLFVLEELPCISTGEWIKFSDSLKYMISGPTLKRKEKNEKDIDVDNYLNFIFLTNKTAIKVDDDDRRYCVLDVSIEKKGDFNYFNELGKYVKNDEVALAFYRYCHEYINDEFDPRDIPETNSKNELIIDNLINVLVCIKEVYLLQKKDFHCKFSDFYQIYVDWCSVRHEKIRSKIEVARILTEHSLPTKNGTANVKYCTVKYAELLKLYQDKHWIHETDEFVSTDSKVETDDLDVGIIQPIKESIAIECKKETREISTQTDEIEVNQIQIQTDTMNVSKTHSGAQLVAQAQLTEHAPNHLDLPNGSSDDGLVSTGITTETPVQQKEILIEKQINEVIESVIKPIDLFDTFTLPEEEKPIKRKPSKSKHSAPKIVKSNTSGDEDEVKKSLQRFHEIFSM